MAVQTENKPAEKLMLDRTKKVLIGGAGPYGLTSALALSKRLGEDAPGISLIEPCDLHSCARWEPCKGCAGGILRGTIEHLVSNYDVNGIVTIKDPGITIETPEGKKYLSRCRVDEIAVHMPHELNIEPPIIKFSGLDVVVPTFRIEGPRYLHDDWAAYNHIGFSPFLYQLLLALNPQVEWTPGRIRMIDTDHEPTQVELKWHDQETTVEADYVLVTTGISKSKPPLVKKGGEIEELPRVSTLKTLMMSTVVPENAVTERVFNIRRGPITLFRAHLFLSQGPAHYILTMPKMVGGRVALSVATFGHENGRDVASDDVNDFLVNHHLFKGAGINFKVEDTYCHCGAFIPNGTLPAEQQYGKSYSLGGDIAGGLRLWKNGIGTAVNEAENFVDHLVDNGYSMDSLDSYFMTTRQRVVEDNQVGRQLLGWVDRILGKATMPQLLQIYLTLEQKMSKEHQWLLPVLGATTTGKLPYSHLVEMLRRGLRGTMLEAFTFVINTPLP